MQSPASTYAQTRHTPAAAPRLAPRAPMDCGCCSAGSGLGPYLIGASGLQLTQVSFQPYDHSFDYSFDHEFDHSFDSGQLQLIGLGLDH
jgi:hypothetical protein